MDGEKEEYMEKIDEMLEKIEDVKFLALLYGLISESIKIREESKVEHNYLPHLSFTYSNLHIIH